MVAVNVLTSPARVTRRPRRPIHTFNIKSLPFQIAPFFVAPVLPGETMKSLTFQSRTVTDPIKNGLIGWWNEYYFFYVKHRDLAISQDMQDLMLQPAKSLTGLHTAAKAQTYHTAATVDYVQLCLNRIVDEYFRDEGHTVSDFVVGGLPLAALNMKHFMDSVTDEDDMPGGPVDNAAQTPTPSTIDDYLLQWEHMRALQVTNMSYEDWLRTYGVNTPKAEEAHKPELLRYVREWSYPVNTIGTSGTDLGVPSAAVSWAQSERADKDRFFAEPGFLIGVTVCRPKVYLGGQAGAGVQMLDTAFGWMPAVMRDEPFTSLRKYATATGPFPTIGDAYWVDMRDLFIHGDQFINYDPTVDDDPLNLVAANAAAASRYYPVETDIRDLFVAEGTDSDEKQWVRQDGVVSLNILGAELDHTQRFNPNTQV